MAKHLLLLLFFSLPALAAPPTTAPAKILILPFAPVDARDREDWVGRGVQQSIAADLARADLQPITDAKVDNNSPIDSAAALKLGRAVSARYVLHGSYQLNDGELRLTAQLLNADAEVDAGRALGSLKATGSQHDLFDLEDSLANQARRLLTPAPRSGPTFAPPREQLAYANVGPLSIAGYRAPSPALSAEQSSRLNLQNANPNDFYLPYYGCYGCYGFGGYYGFFRTPYGVIQSSGSLPW